MISIEGQSKKRSEKTTICKISFVDTSQNTLRNNMFYKVIEVNVLCFIRYSGETQN
jgi:hypothetical protein